MSSIGNRWVLAIRVWLAAAAIVGVSHAAFAQALSAPYTSGDVGSPAVAGGATESGGTFTVRGAGYDIWDTSDQFYFVHQRVTGDVDIRAQVVDVQHRHQWTKGGVMVRESLDAGSPHASTFVTPAKGAVFQRRVTSWGLSANTYGSASATAPYWVRVTRSGSQFRSYISPDGSTWTLVGSETIAMAATVYVGLAVTSHDASVAATVNFADVSATGGGTAPPPASGWANRDIGSPAVAGRASEASGTFSVSGAGADIWDSSDQFHFMYQPVSGDVEVVARVATLEQNHVWSKAGVMIRESLSASAAHAFMAGTSAKGWAFQSRPVAGGISVHTGGSLTAPPGWVRLVRSGNVFSAYESTDGSTWVLVGTETIAMPQSVYVGLAVTSHEPSAASTATFTGVAVRGPAPANKPPAVTLTAPAANSTFTAPASIALAATASDSDGTVSRVEFFANGQQVGSDSSSPYSATWSNVAAGTYNLTAVATDNAGARTTSATATVTVTSGGSTPPPGSAWSNGDVGSPALAGRASESGGTFSVTGAGADIWGSSDQFHFMYQRADGDVEVVARVTSLQQQHAWSKAGVMIRGSLSASAPHAFMTGSAANGWAFQRRASTGAASLHTAGPATSVPGWVRLVRSGSTISGYHSTDGANWSLVGSETIALGQSVYVGLAVTSHNTAATSTAAFSSVAIRALAANRPPTVSLTSPANGASFTAPANITLAATAADGDGSVTRVDFYRGATLIGSDTSAPYSVTWSSAPQGSYSLTAVAHDNGGASTTSAAVSITVGSAPAPAATTLMFTPSPDHATAVTSYSVAIYTAGSSSTGTPAATRDLGKPTPSNNEISVDISTLVNPLAAGSYYAVVTALGPGGAGASTPSATFSK